MRFLSFFLLVSLWGIALQRTAVFECESTEISTSSECGTSELEEDIDQELSSYDSGDIPNDALEGFPAGCGPLLGGDGWHLSAEILTCKMHQYQLFVKARFQLPPFYLLYQTLDGYLG